MTMMMTMTRMMTMMTMTMMVMVVLVVVVVMMMMMMMMMIILTIAYGDSGKVQGSLEGNRRPGARFSKVPVIIIFGPDIKYLN